METSLITLGVIVLTIITIILINIIRNEKKKRKWVKSVEIGSKCSYHFVAGTGPEEMWVSKKIDDDHYEITFLAQKRFMYPNKVDHGVDKN